ncbi:MAG: hypothetical protein KF745_00250 [Phycisphaeraceae bacterium]|nr:hypothetical protein [Phycisphaeraceae bacterium]
MRGVCTCAVAGVVGLGIGVANAQTRFNVNDRTNDSIYQFFDANHNGVIDEPGEVTLYFSAANAGGLPGPLNPTTLGVRRDGLTLMGDQDSTRRLLYLLKDLNGDGDANDAGEAIIAADATNASGVSFAFPTGSEFDSRGRLYVVNAGNTFGNDIIVRLVDLNGDGDFQDVGEITEYVAVPFFGAGNGPYSPQEIVFDRDDAMYLHNSSANLHGVWRFVDANSNGRADDAGEATVFFDSTNASGVTISAGFAIDVDPVRPRSLYFQQTATGGVDQLYRLSDLNADGDANDAGEAVLVFSTAEAGFTVIDALAMYDGRVLLTDNSGKKAIVLTDVDTDGLFVSAGERADYFANVTAVLGDIRQMNIVPCPGDWDRNGVIDPSDIASFINDWFNSLSSGGFRGDFDFNGSVEPSDVAGLVTAWLAALNGAC